MLPGQLLSSPLCRDACCRAEVFQVNFTDGSPVVVPGDDDISTLAQFEYAFIGIRPITDQVTKKPDLVNWFILRKLIDFCKYCFQCFQVGMYIEKNTISHTYFLQSRHIVIG